MNNQVHVRIAKIEDIPLIVKNRVNFMLEIQGEKSQEQIEVLQIELTKYLSSAIPRGEFLAFIAEYQGLPVSFGGLVIQVIPPTFTNIDGKIGYILNMYTQKEHRGRGLCSKIMEQIILEAKQLKLNKLYLNATDDGYPIYQKFNFSAPHWREMELKIEQ